MWYLLKSTNGWLIIWVVQVKAESVTWVLSCCALWWQVSGADLSSSEVVWQDSECSNPGVQWGRNEAQEDEFSSSGAEKGETSDCKWWQLLPPHLEGKSCQVSTLQVWVRSAFLTKYCKVSGGASGWMFPVRWFKMSRKPQITKPVGFNRIHIIKAQIMPVSIEKLRL